MKAYSIFDDFSQEAADIIRSAGIELTIHPIGVPRPDERQFREILEAYECVIIGTSQKIRQDMFENIDNPRIIATASVGLDHIQIPEEKKALVRIVNTPTANARSVAEFTIASALNCIKRIPEGRELYVAGKDNKKLSSKPGELYGKTIGVVGAGNISVKIMEYARMLGMKVIYWTSHPERHSLDSDYKCVPLEDLVSDADVISVNLPDNSGTKGIISADLVDRMNPECIFISVSRLDTINLHALVARAEAEKSFYVCADLDVNDSVVSLCGGKKHVYITPHIAGGTVETRKRMFFELAESIVKYVNT